MADPVKKLDPSTLRERLIRQKTGMMPIIVLFHVTRTVIAELGLDNDITGDQLDTIICNCILDTIVGHSEEGA